MRWSKKIKKEPKLGEMRVITRFAFFPLLINDKYVWLERYKEIQIYTQQKWISDSSNAIQYINTWKCESKGLIEKNDK